MELKLDGQYGALVKRHTLILITSSTLSTLLILLMPQFPHLEGGDTNSNCLKSLLEN